MKWGAQRPPHREGQAHTGESYPSGPGQARLNLTPLPEGPREPQRGLPCSVSFWPEPPELSGLSFWCQWLSPLQGVGAGRRDVGWGLSQGPVRTFCPSPSPPSLSHVASGLGLTLACVLSMAHYAGVPGQAGRCVLWGSGIKAPNQQRKSLSISWRAATGEAPGACCGKQAVGMGQPSSLHRSPGQRWLSGLGQTSPRVLPQGTGPLLQKPVWA